MALNKETVRRVAALARIKVPEESFQRLADELSNIFGWIDQLSEVDTDNVEPMTSVVYAATPQREDRITEVGIPENILANAPQSESSYYTVPKVVE